MPTDYEIIWDGRKAGPGGALIFADELPTYLATFIPQRARKTSAVRDAIEAQLAAKGPQTMNELMAVTQIDSSRVNTALCTLRKMGRVRTQGFSTERSAYGRRQALYAMVTDE